MCVFLFYSTALYRSSKSISMIRCVLKQNLFGMSSNTSNIWWQIEIFHQSQDTTKINSLAACYYAFSLHHPHGRLSFVKSTRSPVNLKSCTTFLIRFLIQ